MMNTIDDNQGGISTATDVQSAWQVINVREGEVTPYFANAFNTKRLPVNKVRSDIWAWFPAHAEGGFFPIPITVSKIGVPTPRPHHFAQSFRRMAQKYSRPHHYVEVEVQDVGADERLFLYWFDPALDVCWAQYGLHQTVRTMILYRRYEGSEAPEDHDVWRFRARLSKMGATHQAHEFTSTSWRFGEATYTMDITAAKQLKPGDMLVERYPFCLQEDPVIGEPVWSNGYAWLPATYGTPTDWDHPGRQAVAFLRDIGPSQWPALIECIQDRYLEDLASAGDLAPGFQDAIRELHRAQYFDGKETIDQYLMWMDPELLVATEHQRLFQLHIPVKQDSFMRLFIKETLDRERGHLLGVYRSRKDAEADHAPYATFPTVGNWLRRLEHEIEIGLKGTWG